MTAACRLYLITPPEIADLPQFATALDDALAAGDVACVQLRLKGASDDPAGTQASGMRGVVFHVLDQVDVVFGAWLALLWVVKPTWARVAGSLGTVYVGHQVVTLVGYWLGMRKTAR